MTDLEKKYDEACTNLDEVCTNAKMEDGFMPVIQAAHKRNKTYEAFQTSKQDSLKNNFLNSQKKN